MNTNPEKYHTQIDAYLREELSKEERFLFEKELNKRGELYEEFMIHKELCTIVNDSDWVTRPFDSNNADKKSVETYFRSQDARDFKDIVIKAQNEFQNKEKRQSNKSWIVPLLAVASVVILVILFNYNSKTSLDDLYVQYNEWQNLPSLTSRGEQNDLSIGEELFEEKRYKESYELFLSVTKQNRTPGILIYLGLSALELNKYEEALQHMNELIKSDTIDSSKGYWYKAMIYLKQGDREGTITALQTLISGRHYNTSKAQELLNLLK